jgi:dual specificity MAP kinase phosphatase
VINVTSHIPLSFESDGIKYIRLPAADNGVQNLRQYFNDAINFIDEVCDSGGRVMVHCQAGVSRSSTIAIAYIMARSTLAMLDAFRFVKSRRPVVAPNFNFMGQLLDFETTLDSGRGDGRRPLPDVVKFIGECQSAQLQQQHTPGTLHDDVMTP